MFDLIIGGILLVTLAVGVSRGFIREVTSVLAWILAGIATFWDIPLLRTFMASHFSSVLIADAMAAVVAFVIAFTIISLIGTVCASLVRGSFISPLDRGLGALAGILKGVVLLSGLEIVVSCFVPRTAMPEAVRSGYLMPIIYQVSDFIYAQLPASAKEHLGRLAKQNLSLMASSPASGSKTSTESNSSAQPEKKPEEPTKPTEAVKELGQLEPKAEASPGGLYTEDQNERLNRVMETYAEPTPPTPSEEPTPAEGGNGPAQEALTEGV